MRVAVFYLTIPLAIGCVVGHAEELIVFAAVSSTETLTALGGEYTAAHPEVETCSILIPRAR